MIGYNGLTLDNERNFNPDYALKNLYVKLKRVFARYRSRFILHPNGELTYRVQRQACKDFLRDGSHEAIFGSSGHTREAGHA